MDRTLDPPEPMYDVMIDLETLDTKPSTLILSIGVCLFDIETGKIHTKYHRYLDLQSQLNDGRTVSESTLLWWMHQSEEARKDLFSYDVRRSSLSDVLECLHSLIPMGARVWSNGSTLDVSVLEHAYNHELRPWPYYMIRDVRTITDLAFPNVDRGDFEFKGTEHNALDDAVHQATYVSAMWTYLKNKK